LQHFRKQLSQRLDLKYKESLGKRSYSYHGSGATEVSKYYLSFMFNPSYTQAARQHVDSRVENTLKLAEVSKYHLSFIFNLSYTQAARQHVDSRVENTFKLAEDSKYCLKQSELRKEPQFNQ